MYIKEIKIDGFKSFADKVNLELLPTFTGIVGPNGTGKSNIIDALRWVLGEQSIKTLRGSNTMTDVIFNGSKTRPESNHASVSVVFDNSDKKIPLDYSEVMIKRTVYRSGENEYYINNEKCRLKDINNLFLDSFAGKETFNIIPQGKISEILSAKAEDRRIIFEEAAGVLKYKNRKEEALRKLEHTHNNIERANMIIDELEVQINPLKIESEKALKYKSLKDSLENIDIALLATDITRQSELFNIGKNKEEELKLKITESTTSNSKDETELEKLKLEKTKLDEVISNLQTKLIESNNMLASLLNKKELTKERLKYDKNSEAVKQNLINLKEEDLKVRNIIKALEIEIKDLINSKKTLTEQINSLNDEFNKLKQEETLLNNEYNQYNRSELEIKTKIDILEDNINSGSRIPYSVKSVLNNPALKGIHDIIGNIVTIEEKYTIMLDVALSASSNFVIVDDEAYAKRAIDYLKQNNKGRVTFLPLSVIKPKSVEPNILDICKSCVGFVGVLSDLVNYDKKYYNIIMNQIGNILVCDNSENAINLGNRINHRYRIVTIDGEIFHVGGSVTGGSIKANSVISDKYELDRLKVLSESNAKKKQESEEKIKNLNYEIEVIKNNIYKNNIDLVKLDELIENKNNSLNINKAKIDNISSEIKDLGIKSTDKIDDNLNKIMDEYYKEESNKKEIEIKLNSNIKSRKNIESDIIDKELIIKKLSSEGNQLLNELKETEINNTRLSMSLDNLLNRLNEEYNLTYEAAKDKYTLKEEEKEARNLVSSYRRELKAIGPVNLSSIEEYERVNKRYTFLNNQKEDLVNSENNLLEIIRDMDDVMIDKFATTFDKVNVEFNKVFKSLFNGGEAHLKYTDPTNILETGIEIMAYPPGKKPSSINLLSGGEKTLTAISLLFAIMNLKQVPFVIFDEVESALDEANVEKFGEYINNYRNKSQLLVITHKKKTMEYVDLLYGITMQESGVSKFVSVKLEDIKKN